MARRETEETVTQSVLERLIDLQPGTRNDPPQTRSQSVRQLKAALRRDLEWLLNTRQIPGGVPEAFAGLEGSLYAYGLPDVSNLSANSVRDRNRLQRMLENTIASFEPRLSGVKVSLVDSGSSSGRQLRFQIEGLLLMDPAPELVSFDTVLQLSSGEYLIRESKVRDDLLLYYERELSFLREMGAEFAEKYPKIAGRLVLDPNEGRDPHVERLLEAFAFLAARVHLKIDDEFPEITEALLTVLYPHYLRPIPSMSIVEFDLDPAQGNISTGLPIPGGSVLYSPPVSGVPCKYRTCYDTTLWPLRLAEAQWRSPDRFQTPLKADAVAALRLEIRCFQDATFDKLDLRSLRFHLNGEATLVHTLYELLSGKCAQIVVRDPATGSRVKPLWFEPDQLRLVGFESHEGALPYPLRSFQGYRLLQEYFSFPDKFFFFELSGLERLAQAGFKDRAEIIFLISRFERAERQQALETGVSEKTVRLNCTPIINLFSQTAEPILLSHTVYEYPIVPDVSRQDAMEIFSVDGVVSVDPASHDTIKFEPFYSFRHATMRDKKQTFWHASRRPSTRRNSEVLDVFLSLVDMSGKPVRPNVDTVTVRLTCTNGDLPSRLPFGNERGDLDLEGAAPIKRIIMLKKPTGTIRPPTGRNALWRLISHLSLNYLSLVEDGREALQHILQLYNFSDSAHIQKQIDGITRLESARHFARVISEHGISFARGTRVKVDLDEEQFVGGGVYLFASVLERFLALYVSMNSFSQLAVTTTQRREVLQQWPPRAGQKILM